MSKSISQLQEELAAAKTALDVLQREHAQLTQEAQLLRIDRRELFFSRLFSGGYFWNASHIASHAAAEDIRLDKPFFLVIAARLEKWGLYSEDIKNAQEIHFIIRNALEYQLPGNHVSLFQGMIAAVLNTAENYQKDIHPLLSHLRQIIETLETEFQITVSFAVSRIYSSPMDISLAWDDTQRVFEYQDTIAEDVLVSAYQELSSYHLKSAPISYVDITAKLNTSLRIADFEGIRSILHELIDHEFGESKPTVDILRFRTYGVVNTLLYLINDLRAVVGNELIDQLDAGPRLTRPMPFSALVDEIDALLDELAALSSKKTETTLPAWVTPVHDYVCQNFKDPNLSVGSVSDAFHVTPTYCSKQFKERYGVRLFDFIQLQRLEAAKALLPTEKSLKDISVAVGFGCALTMTRAFKRYEGVAPTHYRP